MPTMDVDYDRLTRVIPQARRSMEPFRRRRFETTKLAAGPNWGDVSNKTQPLNLIGIFEKIMARNLVAKDPRVKLTTFDQEAKPVVGAMERWANREIKRMELANTLRRIVVDALHMVGIAKIALATPSDAAALSWGLKAGQPCIWRIDLDDFVYDHHARDLYECSFMGHRYRVPLDSIREDSKLYGKNRKSLQVTEDRRYNEQGDEKIQTLARGWTFDSEEFRDMVDLWEIWIPGDNQIVTFASDDSGQPCLLDDEPLRVQDWLGPYCGPYQFLRYGIVAGNAMPKGPILDLIDLHEPTNRALRKLIRQADRLKQTTPVKDTEDYTRLTEANDGEGWKCISEPPKELISGAPNPQLFALFMAMKDLFSWHAGNLDAIAGLAPQAKTLGQDKMLAQSASAGVADMQEETVTFVSRIVESLTWFWKHHPTKVMRSMLTIPATDVTVPTYAYPAQRNRIAWDDIEVYTDPHSLRHQTPQERANALVQIMTQILTPMMPLLQQQGIGIDMNEFLLRLGEYMDQPDLKTILHLVEPPALESGGKPAAPGMPAQTQRSYERVNRSESTQQGTNRMAAAMMMGKQPGGQPSANGAMGMAS